ncbi:MAG: CHRD domain-containing protein [Pseudohongiellaceae bacterium]
MKFHHLFSAIVLVGLLAVGQPALAQTEYRARLSPMPTTPQTVNDITGEGEVTLSLDGNTLSVKGSFSGMSSAATMAHIHNGPMAQPGPVVFRLQLVTEGGDNESNGGDESNENIGNGNISAELELNAEQLAALHANELYVQIHSANNPPGELRGWIFLLSHFENL